MGDTPFFSIIVPVYNAERYIRICINSILEQTFKDFEIIIVDDCSTDNSYKICKELYGENERVKLFRHKKIWAFLHSAETRELKKLAANTFGSLTTTTQYCPTLLKNCTNPRNLTEE